MQTRDWILTAAVIVVPLIIAVVVTMWSLDQVRYWPKKQRPAGVARETSDVGGRSAAGGGDPAGENAPPAYDGLAGPIGGAADDSAFGR